jgi:hypothetical protein
MDREVVEESVVAMEAVVASSNDGGVQGRRSGRPEREREETRGRCGERESEQVIKTPAFSLRQQRG